MVKSTSPTFYQKRDDMKFDVIVGNPPFGIAQKGSSPNFDFSKNRNDVIRKYNVNEIYEA